MERTSGELDILVSQVDKKVDSHIAYTQQRDEKLFEALDRIERQTIKTNGRVGELEKWRDKHDVEHSKSISRIENLEKYLFMGLGALIILEFALRYFKIV